MTKQQLKCWELGAQEQVEEEVFQADVYIMALYSYEGPHLLHNTETLAFWVRFAWAVNVRKQHGCFSFS